eukprot:TRINITY_DN12957_c0_g1_i1.p1 TRINITY_DN12957_c0_g1~~TRINITY_DN12957_c0_g1_i1.p1  ORF type:complete len:692 (-),score=103.99 TRINITY_DN12957_c0_g1_i1:643-2718(-)
MSALPLSPSGGGLAHVSRPSLDPVHMPTLLLNFSSMSPSSHATSASLPSSSHSLLTSPSLSDLPHSFAFSPSSAALSSFLPSHPTPFHPSFPVVRHASFPALKSPSGARVPVFPSLFLSACPQRALSISSVECSGFRRTSLERSVLGSSSSRSRSLPCFNLTSSSCNHTSLTSHFASLACASDIQLSSLLPNSRKRWCPLADTVDIWAPAIPSFSGRTVTPPDYSLPPLSSVSPLFSCCASASYFPSSSFLPHSPHNPNTLQFSFPSSLLPSSCTFCPSPAAEASSGEAAFVRETDDKFGGRRNRRRRKPLRATSPSALFTLFPAVQDEAVSSSLSAPSLSWRGQVRRADPPFRIDAPNQRVVAVGDLHGDWDKTRGALRLAGVLSLDDEDQWVGGTAILVQVGDVLDRGGDEVAILSLLRHLNCQAQQQGGAVYQVHGNHETMNVAEDFRYVTEDGYHECDEFVRYCMDEHGGDWESALDSWWRDSQLAKAEQKRQGETGRPWNSWMQSHRRGKARSMLFQVGGPLACELARHGVVLQINDTLFAHGGVLPHHVNYGLDRLNKELSRWMRGGEGGADGEAVSIPYMAMKGYDSVVWSRLYSRESFESPMDRRQACAALSAALDMAGVRRLVVGHTPQVGGANSECGGRVWRIDVGMSSGIMSAPPQVLEIVGSTVRVLRSLSGGVHANIK